MKSKKQDKIGVAPLKRSGGLTNESKEKAAILSNQFKSVFTKLKRFRDDSALKLSGLMKIRS